jgi:hypothetical protein
MEIEFIKKALDKWQNVGDAREQLGDYDRIFECVKSIAPKDLDALADACVSEEAGVSEIRAILESVFTLGEFGIRVGISNHTLDYLVPLFRRLALKGVFVPSSQGYLSQVLSRFELSRHESDCTADAIQSLTDAVECNLDGNADVLFMPLAILDTFAPALNQSQAKRLVEILTRLQQKIDSGRWTKGEARILGRLKTGIEYSFHIQDVVTAAFESKSPIRLTDPSQVISVHSTKGGVGKTFFATALAVALAKEGRRVCIVDTDDQGPGVHFAFEVDATFSEVQSAAQHKWRGSRNRWIASPVRS